MDESSLKHFIFGTATSSYQIEGAFNVDGRTDSIWDVFSKTKGKVLNGDNGDMACDHYSKFIEDVMLLKELGVDSYRFSISWSRIFPEKGKYNEKGMDFYKKLIKQLLDNHIRPSVTLYHWDLPMWVQNEGGWANRKSVDWFLEYAETCFIELGDVVDFWITHNEPFCAGFLGYYVGVHAPGIQDLSQSLQAIHHILLSHGKAVELYRRLHYHKGIIGITLNLTYSYPKTLLFQDKIAANNHDGFVNRWFLDPVFNGTYPADMLNLFSKEVNDFSFIKDGDLEIISIPIDFLGVNYYNSTLLEYDDTEKLLYKEVAQNVKKTAMGWPITPNALKDIIYRLRKVYTNIPIFITENGAAFDDQLGVDNMVHDNDRIDYVNQHLQVLAELNEENMNIVGYYLWSFMDNFEWSFGYSKRFGIVYVDFETLQRTKKESFYYYANIIKNRLTITQKD